MYTILFVDDTTLLFKKKSFENLIISTNNDLIKYRERTIANAFSLSVNKTHTIIFTNKPMPYEPQIAYHQQILNIKEECIFLC